MDMKSIVPITPQMPNILFFVQKRALAFNETNHDPHKITKQKPQFKICQSQCDYEFNIAFSESPLILNATFLLAEKCAHTSILIFV